MNIGLLYKNTLDEEQKLFVQTLAQQTSRMLYTTDIIPADADATEQLCDNESIDLLFISCRNNRRDIQHYLNLCRNLRLPYIFLTDTMQIPRTIATTVSPVSMLEEEVHKAEILTHLARFTGTHILFLLANDYGSRAEQNLNKILTALQSLNINAETLKADKDSFAVNKEAAEKTRQLSAGMLVLTASRDYGLDDIFFGPQELHAIRKSHCPVLMLNPRGDLYSLCD